MEPRNPFLRPAGLWPSCTPVTHLVTVQPLGVKTAGRPLPDIILWLQWILWHALSRSCHRLLLQHYEILPVCLGLPFKGLSDSKSGWEQQDELGVVYFRRNSFPPLLLGIHMRPFNEISQNRERSLCRLTQPCSLSCKNAENSFSAWLSESSTFYHASDLCTWIPQEWCHT